MRLITFGLVPVLFVGASVQDPVDHAQMLQRAQQLGRTFEPHQRLQRLVGTWDITVRTTPPGGQETTDKGTVVGKELLGGRYVVLNYKLQLQGHALEALQILGFDNLHQRFTASWRDDLSTWSVECHGALDANAPTVMRMAGELADAKDPDGRPFRIEFELGEKDTVVMQMFDTHQGELLLWQRQQWTRR